MGLFGYNHRVLYKNPYHGIAPVPELPRLTIGPGSQYDAGAVSVTSIVSIMEKVFFHQSNCIPDVKFFDNLIGWTLANAHDATLE